MTVMRTALRRLWARQRCLHTANRRGMMVPVDITYADRFALVPVTQLDDLVELARLASERLPETDPLATALRGAAGAVRFAAVLEP